MTLFGDLSVYAPHGRYQLITKIALHSGEGRLQIEYERLKRALAAEGLFDAKHKLPLPAFPRRLAVITSPTGAALRDFLRILERRNFIGSIVLYPVRVQGKEAAREIEDALQRAIKHSNSYDAIVLTRGGGSIEDMWPFNDESLARVVARSPIATISAVGHEIDQVLTDYTADIRAETPSAAAELISSQSLEIRRKFFETSQLLRQLSIELPKLIQKRLQVAQTRFRLLSPERQFAFHTLRIDDAQIRLKQTLKERIGRKQNELQALASRLSTQHPTRRLDLAHQNLLSHQHRLKFASAKYLQAANARLQTVDRRLENTNIQTALSRGFSIIENIDGRILSSAAATKQAHQVKARFHDGSVLLHPNKKPLDKP